MNTGPLVVSLITGALVTWLVFQGSGASEADSWPLERAEGTGKVSVGYASYNAGNKAPKEKLFGQILCHAPTKDAEWCGKNGASAPHLLAVTVQEVPIWFSTHEDTLESWVRAATGLDYKFVVMEYQRGVTEWTPNSLAVFVFALGGDSAPPLPSHISKANYRSGMEGKGGVIVRFQYNGQRLAFAGLHLNSKSQPDREKEERGVMSALLPQQTGGRSLLHEVYDQVFIMGDLNYRLQAPQSNRATVGEMVTWLSESAEDLLKLDALPAMSTLVTPQRQQDAFTFHLPAPMFMPTYKRTVGAPACAELDASPSKETIRNCFFPDAGSADGVKIKAGSYQLGWLDRIGSLEAGAPVTVQWFHVVGGNTKSDHAAVVARVIISP